MQKQHDCILRYAIEGESSLLCVRTGGGIQHSLPSVFLHSSQTTLRMSRKAERMMAVPVESVVDVAWELLQNWICSQACCCNQLSIMLVIFFFRPCCLLLSLQLKAAVSSVDDVGFGNS